MHNLAEDHAKILDHCYSFARRHSHDPRTQNGAMIVSHDGDHQVWVGVNGLTPNISKEDWRLVSPHKYLWFEHSERAAIFCAVKNGVDVTQATLFCPWAACADCARAIALSGIPRLVRHKQAMERIMGLEADERWTESIQVGDEIMRASGVEIVDYDYISESSETLTVMFDGRLWDPHCP